MHRTPRTWTLPSPSAAIGRTLLALVHSALVVAVATADHPAVRSGDLGRERGRTSTSGAGAHAHVLHTAVECQSPRACPEPTGGALP